VVVYGVKVVAEPDVTVPTPLLILAVPSAKTAVKLTLSPKVIVSGAVTKLAIVGAGTTVTVTVDVTAVPAALVTVTVYVVVDAGETELATLDVTIPTPLSILAVPSEKTAVKLTVSPKVMVKEDVTKLAIVGAGTTVTVTVDVTVSSTPLVTVTVYVVVDTGETGLGALDVTSPTPLSILAVPSAKTAVKLTLSPRVIVSEAVTKLPIVGSGTPTMRDTLSTNTAIVLVSEMVKSVAVFKNSETVVVAAIAMVTGPVPVLIYATRILMASDAV